MLLSAAQKDALRTIAMVWLAIGTGLGAIALSIHPAVAPPALGTPDLHASDYSGSRILLGGAEELPPPAGCGAVTYPVDEAELRTYLATLYDYGNVTDYPYPMPPAAGPTDTTAAGAFGSSPGVPEFSTTNNQVAGVDELDITKTDGLFVYTVSGGQVVIVRAYPADIMEVTSTIQVDGYAQGLFVYGDRLVVLMSSYGPYEAYAGDALFALPYFYYSPQTEVRVYDISDRWAPAQVFNASVTGSLNGARMIGDFVYVVTTSTAYLYKGDLALPTVEVDGVAHEVAPSSIGIAEGATNTTLITTILTANVTGAAAVKSFTFLTPAGGEIYVSAHNLYLMGATYSYSPEFVFLSTETVLSKFSLYRGEVLCYFSARIPGTTINQFSADESFFEGHPYLRVATTVRSSDWRNSSASVYVLNEKLELVGSLEGIAPGETVQASRFLGERGYLVTFRRVDPLFILDLSQPTDPHILSELTLPGFSMYLQPIDAGHLIGIGVDATDTGRATGLKLSLFDVSDSEHPWEVANYTFGGYAYSEAQYDHKAVLYMPSRHLLVIPVQIYDYSSWISSGSSFQGVYVFRVDVETGFSVEAKIQHEPMQTSSGGGTTFAPTYSYTPQVRRSLFIGPYLYTVSEHEIKANELESFAEVATVTTGSPSTGPIYY